MMYDLQIAWRNIRNRPVQMLIPVLVVALAIALSVSVFALSDGAEEGIVQASDPFGVLVIGSAGSGQELVLSTVLLQGNPIGNIPYNVYENLRDDGDRVQLAVPLAMGDSYEGARIIGTDLNFFELRSSRQSPPAFQVAQGRLFEMPEDHAGDDHSDDEDHADDEHTADHSDDEDHADDEHTADRSDEDHADEDHDHGEVEVVEAVIGAKTAATIGLSIGDQFFGTHGIGPSIAENTHDHIAYEVVGILQPSGTPYDTAIYTPIQNVWRVHQDEPEDDDGLNLAGVPGLTGLTAPPETAAAPETDEVTAVMVLPTSFVAQNQLAQEFYTDPTLQAAFPGEELGNLLGLLNQGQAVLEIVGYLMLATAGLTLFLSMYSAVLARQQAIAIMRGLGSNRASIFRIIIFETLMVSVAGALFGRLLGYGLAWTIASVYSAQSAIPVPIRFLPELESVLWALTVGVGVLAGLVPAVMAYRVDVVDRLFPA